MSPDQPRLAREQMARRHATENDAEVGEAEARLAQQVAEVRRLEAVVARQGLELRDAQTEVGRLRELVGDENQPGWDGCSRAEAIRQANEFHAGQLRWMRMHDERRDEAGRVALSRIAERVIGLSDPDDVHDDERLRFGEIRAALVGDGG